MTISTSPLILSLHKSLVSGNRYKLLLCLFQRFHSSLSRQQERKKLIENFCKRTGKVRPRAEPIFQHISVNESLKIIYCITPKCASRELRLMLFPKVHGKNVPKLLPQPAEKLTMMLETYLKFTFVREPFERIPSAYKDKFVHLRRIDRPALEFHGREILKNFRPNATREALTKSSTTSLFVSLFNI